MNWILAIVLAFQSITFNVKRDQDFPLGVLASDNTAVARVEFYVDSRLIGTLPGTPVPPNVAVRYTISWHTPKRRGTHSFVSIVYDVAGNHTSVYATIVVH